MDPKESVDLVCALARKHIRAGRVQRAKERQSAVLAKESPDYLPLLFGGEECELKRLPSYDWAEQWHDPAKSFVEQMKGVVNHLAGGSDYVPAVRADTGVINAPSMFGIEFHVPAHTKPVATGFPPKDAIRDFNLPEDIGSLGIVPRVIEHIQFHRETLRAQGLEDFVGVHHCDTQGPFDIACQVRGHDIFTDLYDDPAFVRHLMEESLKAYVALTRLCKTLQGEGPEGGNAAGLWMKRGAVRMCDDSGILIPPTLYQDLILPYMRRGLDAFGGGWIHYCGGIPGGGRPEGLHLHDLYLQIPSLCGLNFTTGRDLEAEVRKILARGVAYYGGWPRLPNEPLKAYFRRVLSVLPGRWGLIFAPALNAGESATAMDEWHRAQDEVFGKQR